MEQKTPKSVFLDVIDRGRPEEWPQLLDEVCDSDATLRREVERLLSAHGNQVDLVRHAEAALMELTVDQPPAPEKPGTQIGPYKLREKIGEGGFGVVYVAQQSKPVRRKVALKIIKPGMDTKDVIARFEAERQALALMEHPNVAKVLDAGATDTGRPYFVMELVKGIPITEFCDEHKLSTQERLDLFCDVCRAVQHAHQKGIIHRDLKPSNVMVTLHDDKPVVKVIDFGVAKALSQQLTENSVYTAFDQIIGTPLYMSPEQAQLSGLDVDTRSDVYSLGVLLYELLTGTTPFDRDTLKNAGFDEMRRMIREDEPPRPSARVSTLKAEALSTVSDKRRIDPRKLGRSFRGELDWIVMKSLEKDRNRRYESASAFAADIDRYVADEPVQARPASMWYRLRKTVRRNKGALAATLLIAISLVVGATAATIQAVRATAAEKLSVERLASETRAKQSALRDRAAAKLAQAKAEGAQGAAVTAKNEALRQRDVARYRKYLSDIRLAQSQVNKGALGLARDILKNYIAAQPDQDLRNWEWHYLWSLIHQNTHVLRDKRRFATSDWWNRNVDWCPDGKRIAAVTARGTIQIWNVKDNKKERSIHGPGAAAVNVRGRGIRWAPDGRHLASVRPGGSITVWNATTGRKVDHLILKEVVDYCWRGNGSQIAFVQGDGIVRIWNLKSKQVTLLRPPKTRHTRPNFWSHQYVAWSSDGELIASTNGYPRIVRLWNVKTKRHVENLSWNGSGVLETLAFSPSSARLAIANSDGTVCVSNPKTGQVELTFSVDKQSQDPLSIQWSPDGRKLSVGDGGRIDIHDARSGRRMQTFRAWGNYFSWHPDGHQIATTVDGTLRIHDTRMPQEYTPLKGHFERVWELTWGPQSKRLASVGANGIVRIWDVPTGREVFSRPFPPRAELGMAVSGRRAVLRINGIESFSEIRGSGPENVTLSADERFLVVHSEQRTLVKGTLEDLEARRRKSDYRIRVTRLAKQLYCVCRPILTVWDVEAGHKVLQLEDAVASNWHPLRPHLAVVRRTSGAGEEKTEYELELWDVVGQQQVTPGRLRYATTTRPVPPNGLRRIVLDWSPDANHVAIHSESVGVLVVDAKTFAVVHESAGRIHPSKRVERAMHGALLWSSDGQRLAYAVRGRSKRRFEVVAIFDVEKQKLVARKDLADSRVSAIRWRTHRQIRLRISARHKGRNELWLLSTVTGNSTRNRIPVVDGRQIHFMPSQRNIVLNPAQSRYIGGHRLYNPRTVERILDLPGGISPDRLAWSPDGKHVAFATSDGLVGLWSAQIRSGPRPVARTLRSGIQRQADSWNDLAEEFAAYGKPAEAVNALREAERLSKQLVKDAPSVFKYHRRLVFIRSNVALQLERMGRHRESDQVFRRIFDECEDVKEQFPVMAHSRELSRVYVLSLNASAWVLATRTEPRYRNATESLKRATLAVALLPQAGALWNTLGVAHYRNGNWDSAVKALQESMRLQKGGNAFDWFFLAMAEAQRGRKSQAKTWHARAVAWMNKHAPKNPELTRFRAEAATVIAGRAKALQRSPIRAPRPSTDATRKQ